MKLDGYKIVNEAMVLSEEMDKTGIERGRFNRFVNSTVIHLKSGVRQLVMALNISKWPESLWAHAVNLAKMIYRIGTGKNQDLKVDLMHLGQMAASGKFKTGKEYNNALQAVMKKHNLRHQPMFDHAEQ